MCDLGLIPWSLVVWHGLVDREQKLVCASTLGSFRSMVRFDGTREEDLGTNPLPFRKLNLLGSGFQNPEWGSSWIEHLNRVGLHGPNTRWEKGPWQVAFRSYLDINLTHSKEFIGFIWDYSSSSFQGSSPSRRHLQIWAL